MFARIARLFSRSPSADASGSRPAGERQPTVLLAWELGGGLGHLHRLTALARALASRGCRVLFAVRELDHIASIKDVVPDAPVFPSPVYIRSDGHPGPLRSGCTYADVLFQCGYASADALEPLVRGWHTLFADLQPDLVIGDHAPTMVLAAAGAVPAVHLGSGFATPPVGRPFLQLNPTADAGAEQREAQVLESIRAVQRVLEGPIPAGVPELLGLAENVTCCLPELDPYRSVRCEPAPGPIATLPSPTPPAPEGYIFGYLNGADPKVQLLLHSVARSKLRCRVYARDATDQLRSALSGSSVELLEAAQSMPDALAGASAILHQGGMGTSEIALAGGRLQLLFPRNVEQALTASALEAMGCGVNLARAGTDIGYVIKRAQRNAGLSRKVLRAAEDLANRPKADVCGLVADTCFRRMQVPQQLSRG